MHPTGSFCYTVCEKARAMLDKPTVDAKYNDSFILRNFVTPAMADVFAHLNLTYDNPVVIRHQVDVVAGTPYYQLPPSVQEIWWVVILDDNGNIFADAYPRGTHHPRGRGWAIEGNLLVFDPIPDASLTCHLFYVPRGEYLLHYGTGTLAVDADDVLNTFTLMNTPTLGMIDRRVNAYAGQTLRLLPASPAPIEERIIATHTYGTSVWTVTTRVPFTETAEGSVLYEIAPPCSEGWWEAIAAATAKKLGVPCGISMKQMQSIEMQFRRAVKTIGDNVSNLQLRTGKAFDPDTLDNSLHRWLP